MTEQGNTGRYGLVAQGFHWLVVLLIIVLLVSDSLREGAPKGSDLRTDWLNLHMTAGILLFFVTIARIGWGRLVPSPPPVPAPHRRKLLKLLVASRRETPCFH